MSTGESINAQLNSFGANIRRVRSSKGMTQERLAELANLNPRTVQKIEAGETNILITTLARLAKALDADADSLLKGM